MPIVMMWRGSGRNSSARSRPLDGRHLDDKHRFVLLDLASRHQVCRTKAEGACGTVSFAKCRRHTGLTWMTGCDPAPYVDDRLRPYPYNAIKPWWCSLPGSAATF